jgi:hypothetical protein
MDEEVGLSDDGEGLDFSQIEAFDEWAKRNFKKYLYASKSICAFRVRRKDKDYGDPFINAFANQDNKRTYFLIRNGENLYRIWSNISIGNRIFPALDEYKKILSDKDSFGDSRENLKALHEKYFYGLIAIQGIIERTDILGVTLRQDINLMKNENTSENKVNFIRDDETKFWITDGKLSWNEFINKNRESIGIGTRVVLSTKNYYYRFNGNSNDMWRCAPYRASKPPSREVLYTIEDIEENRSKAYKFFFKSYDEIYTAGYESHIRTKRVPWRCYSDEIINFDTITWEDAEYYESNRLDREHYLELLPTIHWIKQIKKEEWNLENELTRFLAGELGWGESKYKEIREAITWWKLKNKWKRAVTVDEALAIKMILKKLRKNK